MSESTIPEMFFAQAERYRDRAVLKAKRNGTYRDISWGDLKTQVEEIAMALLDLGLAPGDRAAILSESRPEWAVADLAVLSLGGVTVPIYTTLTPSEIEHILSDSGAHLLFVSTPQLMGKVLDLQERLNLKIILFDAPYRVSGPKVWWFGELLGLGRTAGPGAHQARKERLARIKAEELASVIYTSGTTGPPKGVMLTHSNFLSNCRAVREILPMGDQDLTLSFLPLSHVFERMAGYYFVLMIGGTIAYAENLDSVPTNLLEARPTVITGVPRFYEKLRERILAAVQASPAPKRAIIHWAIRVGRRRSQLLTAGRRPWGLTHLLYRIADRLVFSELRARLGGRLRFCVSGGAPLAKELGEFFHAAGILLLEGYGLTETSPVITVNRPDRVRFGTVGLPLPGVELRIAEDGEILTRGPHVMRGYFQSPAATAEVIDAEGWFHTGDIGEMSAGGFLTITDRKKDLIKTSGGKMVAPQNLEARLKADPLIEDCVVIGDRRKFLTALIVPDLQRLAARARRPPPLSLKPHELVRAPEAQALVWERIQRLNETLASFEQIKRITLLPAPFALGTGELTPTLKVKRRVINERYAEQIDAMYREDG